jgi:uncharacterized membrane protein YfcA
MNPFWLASYALAGAAIGVFAGMLGVGGGMTIVPIFALMFTAQHFAPNHIVHISLATAMASIIFTSAASVREHHKRDAVDWDVVLRMAPGMLVGTLAATLVSGMVPQRLLALCFAVIVTGAGIQIGLNRKPKAARALPGPLPLFGVGLFIGVVAGLVSAGGAFLSMPFMVLCGVPVIRAIGTGAALSVPVAVMGSIGYVISGWSAEGLPPYSLGFIYLPALVAMVCTSMLTAPFGARLAHRLPVKILRRIFATVLFVLAARMLWSYW